MVQTRQFPDREWWRQNSLPPLSVLVRAVAIFLALTLSSAQFALAEEVQYASDFSTRLNPTGRTVTLSVALRDGGVLLGEVVIQISAADDIRVEKASVVELVSPSLKDSFRDVLASVPDSEGFTAIDEFKSNGLNITFDSGLQELTVELAPEQRSTSDLDFGTHSKHHSSSNLAHPEPFSGYFNILAGFDKLWNDEDYDEAFGGTSGTLELESAVRVGGVVIENRGAYDGDVDANICPVEASCIYGHVSGLKRQSSRLVYDMPEQKVRALLGDTEAISVPLQRSTELLGLSLEKSDAKFRPGQTISATSRGSFRIERAAAVDVHVNGSVVQTLRLRSGNYNLRDLPLSTGANTVELEIVDEAGERQTLTFTAYSDPSLLATGSSEWAVAGGAPSYLIDDERTYGTDTYLGTGFFRYGLTDMLTGEADLQGDADVIMGGLGFTTATDWGVFGLHGAGSMGEPGTGFAADLRWRLSSFEGLSGERNESLQFDAEYRSTDFHTPGAFLTTASGVLYPEFNYWLRLNASYSFPIDDQVTASISGRYQFGDEDRAILSPYTIASDRYGADLTISRPLGPTANASFLVGYSNEIYVHDLSQQSTTPDADFRVALRLNVRPRDTTSIAASYDTLGNQSTVSAYQAEGQGIDRWDANVDIQSRHYEETASVNAAAGYYGNRAQLRLSHYSDAVGVDFNDLDNYSTRQRTSLRVGTSIAFAGDKIAVGAPVRGGAFAIVSPHDSLVEKDVIVGNVDNVRAKADSWGNGVVTDLPAYLPVSMPVDVDDLPLGYSLGSAAFETSAPYKAGYAIEVGSAYSVSVYGTLLTADGEPVSLLTGLASIDRLHAKPVTIFTNAEGKFGAEGLSPGRWIVEMRTDGSTTQYVVDVPEGSNGLIRLGTLRPMEGTPR